MSWDLFKNIKNTDGEAIDTAVVIVKEDSVLLLYKVPCNQTITTIAASAKRFTYTWAVFNSKGEFRGIYSSKFIPWQPRHLMIQLDTPIEKDLVPFFEHPQLDVKIKPQLIRRTQLI